MAAGKSTAHDLGAHICFADESGQSLIPPKGRTWAPRGARPVVRVAGRRGGRVNIAGVVCFKSGHRPRMFFKLHVNRGRRGEPKTFAWNDYRDFIRMVHLQLGTPVVWVWDNLSTHLQQELFDFEAEHKDWLVIFHLPPYAPEINPQEGIWSLLKRALADFAAADLAHLTRVIKRKLKKIQYRPHLITGCLPTTGLDLQGLIETPDITDST
ncbi:transposase [Streptomyces broussonetiae]|uniref:Transposase n=1 Tax=Streptomyces broussonetiae TaxID=2686304 RepID=A0ABV5EMH1_9ACTN